MRVHPVQGKTFLDVIFLVRVSIEDEFRQEPIDSHDGYLPCNLHFPAHYLDVLARPDLARFIGRLLVVLQTALRIAGVFLESFPRIFVRWDVEAISIGLPQIDEVEAIRESILSESENRMGLFVRFAVGGDESAARIGAAKIDAAPRN